jgi:hypothetical protein
MCYAGDSESFVVATSRNAVGFIVRGANIGIIHNFDNNSLLVILFFCGKRRQEPRKSRLVENEK